MVGGGGGKRMEGNTEVGERREGVVLGGFTGETWVSFSSSWRVIHLALSALPAMAVSQGLHCPPGVYGLAWTHAPCLAVLLCAACLHVTTPGTLLQEIPHADLVQWLSSSVCTAFYRISIRVPRFLPPSPWSEAP